MRTQFTHFIIRDSNHGYSTQHNNSTTSQEWPWLFTLGVAFIFSGVISIALPQIVTNAINILFGMLLLTIGLATAYYAYRVRKLSYDRWPSLTSFTLILCGLLLIIFPKIGAMSITLIIAIFFIFTGLGKLTLAQVIKSHASRIWIFLSGFIDLSLSFLIFFNLNSTSDWLLGLLLGISLIMQGLWNIRLSLLLRKVSNYVLNAI